MSDFINFNEQLLNNGIVESNWSEYNIAVGHDGCGNLFFTDGRGYSFYDHENDIATAIGNLKQLSTWITDIYG